jgi:micrococcal nuclease
MTVDRPARRGRVMAWLALAVALATAGCSGVTGDPTGPARSTPPSPPGREAALTDVVDGDTVKVRLDGVTESVRIIGIDTPESRRPGTPVECFAREATDAAERLLPEGSSVWLEPDPTQDTRDRYGRLLAHVWLADGRLFAETMIRDGYGIHYVYDGIPSSHAARLAAAQVDAERAESGLWAADTCAGDPHTPASATPG